MRTTAILVSLMIGACGGGGKSPDAPSAPAMITISGVATQQSATGTPPPAPGVTVSAYKTSDPGTVVAMTTTDANGMYTLMVPTGGVALDGFLKASLTGNVDTYLFPPAPLTADFADASINELDTNLYDLVAQTIGKGQPGQGMIALEVVDATMATVAGVSVSSSPAAPHTGYSSTGSPLPDITATQTLADGRAFLFGLAPGDVTLSATLTGATFHSHSVKVFADSFITTVVSE